MTRQTVAHVPIERLTAHPANIRDDLGDLTEMALSIAQHGILQPLTATEDLATPGKLLLLAGHRRLGAACLAKLNTVPVIIRHDITDEADHLVLMLVENTQRRDLNPVERAEAYGALRNRGLNVTEIALRTGAAAPTVTYYLNLLLLDEEEREDIRAGARAVSNVLAQVRTERQEARERLGLRPVGRPKGSKTKPYFSGSHPLARAARRLCGHRGVPKVGEVACGPCWEQAIRGEVTAAVEPSRAEPSRAEPSRAEPSRAEPDGSTYDEAVVIRALDGDRSVTVKKHDRAEIVRRAHARGLSDSQIAVLAMCSDRQVLRIRKNLDLPANFEAGANGFSARQEAS